MFNKKFSQYLCTRQDYMAFPRLSVRNPSFCPLSEEENLLICSTPGTETMSIRFPFMHIWYLMALFSSMCQITLSEFIALQCLLLNCGTGVQIWCSHRFPAYSTLLLYGRMTQMTPALLFPGAHLLSYTGWSQCLSWFSSSPSNGCFRLVAGCLPLPLPECSSVRAY